MSWKRLYKKIASIQVDSPFCTDIGRLRERGFGPLPEIYWDNLSSSIALKNVPAAKCVQADLLEFAAPENAEVISARKFFAAAAVSEDKLSEKTSVVVAEERLQAESFQQSLQINPTLAKRLS